MVKMKKGLVMLMGSVLAGGYNYDMDSSEYNKRMISRKKPIPNGLKEFEINGHKIYAINKKNAIRKAKKKGIL